MDHHVLIIALRNNCNKNMFNIIVINCCNNLIIQTTICNRILDIFLLF